MNDIAGWITIGTKLDNKNLEKQLIQQKKQLEKYAKEQEKLLKQRSEAEANLKPYEDEIKALEEVIKKREEYAKMIEETEGRPVKASFGIETIELKDRLAEINGKYKEQKDLYDEINQKILRNNNNIANTSNEIAKMEAELKRNTGWAEVKKSIESSSKSLSGVIKKMGKYALAIVGIRGAYSMITRAINTISQYDKQVAKDMQYIRYVLATLVKPVVEWIVKAIYQVLMAVGALVKRIFGFNIFAKASAKNMNSMAKSAKQIDKSLANFDEANILNDPSKGGISPSFDLSKDNIFAGLNINDFIEKGKEIAGKLAEGINKFFETINWGELANTISTALIGTIDILDTFIQNVDWNKVGQSIADFLLTFDWLGLGTSLFNLIIDGMLAVIDLVSGITSKIVEKLEDPKFWEDLVKAGSKMADKIAEGIGKIQEKLEDKFKEITNWLETKVAAKLEEIFGTNITQAIMTPIRWIFGWITTAFTENIKGLKLIFGGLSNFLGGDFTTGLKKIFAGIITIFLAPINAFISGINAIIKGLNKISIKIPDFLGGGTFGGFKIKEIPKLNPQSWLGLAGGGIVDVPKTGVRLGNARVGEDGREGVLPFEKPGVMQEMGKEIGKWVTVNIDLTNTIDGRILNRRLEQISANNSFARNGAE